MPPGPARPAGIGHRAEGSQPVGAGRGSVLRTPVEPGEHASLSGHMARPAKPVPRAGTGEAVVIVRGPGAYILRRQNATKAEHHRVVPGSSGSRVSCPLVRSHAVSSGGKPVQRSSAGRCAMSLWKSTEAARSGA
ncbi:FMN-binding negative transcriptional regulator [Streptomyces sp. NPDC048514]|uniref:FMN-binding negative transcriptional regulator n=1 Tax=Streptomyces sp. NPDC048514 TaxID=3365564 RepID=UPI003715EEA0